MNEDKVELLLNKKIFMTDSFIQQLSEALEPSSSKGDIFSNIISTAEDERRLCRIALRIMRGEEI